MNKGIQNIFSEVPETYELINHILTFGLDVVWRKRAAKAAAMAGGNRWIDMCSGTGEMASNLSNIATNGTKIYAADFSLPMLDKARLKPNAKHIKFVLSDIKELPFPNDTFNLITISFATRNINLNRDILIQSFKEFYRVLQPGGYFINLETSQPSHLLIRRLFHLYTKLFIKRTGTTISGSRAGYVYLSRTIPLFYNAEELADIMLQAGFRSVDFQKFFFGVAAIHQGIKD